MTSKKMGDTQPLNPYLIQSVSTSPMKKQNIKEVNTYRKVGITSYPIRRFLSNIDKWAHIHIGDNTNGMLCHGS